MLKRVTSYFLLIALSLFLVNCGSGGGAGGEQTQTQAFETEFEIIMEEGTKKYFPMEATVTGDHGTITVKNTLDAEHGFVIREFGIEAAIPAGETQQFTVDSASPGEYMVDCHLHSAHAEATLTVEKP